MTDRGSCRPLFLSHQPNANRTNPLVAFRQGDKLVTTDDLVDLPERPVVGALEHLAQDRVGRIGAIGQNDACSSFKALLLIGGECCDRIAVLKQRRGQRPCIQDRLTGAIGAARHHRVRGVAG
jgi:hypothetical protein